MISHDNIEQSLNKYLYDNLEVPYSYAINYREVAFNSDIHDIFLSLSFEVIGAGAKKPTLCKLDVVSRIVEVEFNNDETLAIDRIRERLTNADFVLYDFSSGSPIVISNEKLFIKNSEGRRTVERVTLDTSRSEDLKRNLKRSSIFFNLELLSDTIGGRVI